MNLNSRIYIAGHSGLVGSNILKRLVKDGYQNIITKELSQLDLRRQYKVENFFEQEKPEYVFLAAARVGGILANDTYKADFIYDNLMIASNITYASYRFGVKKLLNLGSSCIYPKNAKQPLKEEYLLSDYLEPTNEPYAIAKIAAIKLCRYYNEQYKTNFISVMPTNLYGPGDNFNLETAHVLPMILRKFHLAKLLKNKAFEAIVKDFKRYQIGYNFDNKIGFKDFDSIKNILQKIGITENKVVLWGSGKSYREFLYIQDLVDALMFLMKNFDYSDLGEFINIGCGIDIQIRDLANVIKNIVGFDGLIEYDSSRPDGTPQKLLDVSRINKLGWQYKVNLKDGIKGFYKWYLESIGTQKKYFSKTKEEKRVVN